MSINQIGAPVWKIEKIISKGDYNYAKVKTHPNSNVNGYVLEHRIVIENHLKRLLNPCEIVHHIDGDRKNNRIENLELMNNSEHARHHALRVGKWFAKLKCPKCNIVFERAKNKTHITKGGMYTSCSRECSGSISRSIQLSGLTDRVEKAISENIVSVYKKYADDNSEETANDGIRRGHTPSI